MTQERKALRRLVRGALIAAIYAVLCAALAPISYGEVQFRISEALTILPLLMPEAIPGLFVGCLIANLIGGAGILDIVFGSLAFDVCDAQAAGLGGAAAGGGGQRPCRGLGAERGLRNAAAAGDGVGCAGPGGGLLRAGAAAAGAAAPPPAGEAAALSRAPFLGRRGQNAPFSVRRGPDCPPFFPKFKEKTHSSPSFLREDVLY